MKNSPLSLSLLLFCLYFRSSADVTRDYNRNKALTDGSKTVGEKGSKGSGRNISFPRKLSGDNSWYCRTLINLCGWEIWGTLTTPFLSFTITLIVTFKGTVNKKYHPSRSIDWPVPKKKSVQNLSNFVNDCSEVWYFSYFPHCSFEGSFNLQQPPTLSVPITFHWNSVNKEGCLNDLYRVKMLQFLKLPCLEINLTPIDD